MGAVRRAFSVGLGQAGTDKLASALKLSEKSAGIIGAGLGAAGIAGSALVKTFSAANNLAGEQADKLAAMAEDLRRSSRINLFVSSADGFGSLSGQIAQEREKMQQLRELRTQVDPFGFGGGAVGTTKTLIAQAQEAKTDLLASIPKGARDAMGLSQASKPTPPHPQSNRNHQSLMQVISQLNVTLGGILSEAQKVSTDWQ